MIRKTDILPSFCSEHSPFFMSYKKLQDLSLGKCVWKFNNCPYDNDDKYTYKKMSNTYLKWKNIINVIESSFDTIFENSPHSRWEFLKYELHKFTIRCSKAKAKERREKIKTLEENLRTLKQDLKNGKNIWTKYDLWWSR